MTPEHEREIRMAVEQLHDPLWPGLTESDWATWARSLLTEIDRLREGLERIDQRVSWCRHGEADRGETLDLIEQIVNEAFRRAPNV